MCHANRRYYTCFSTDLDLLNVLLCVQNVVNVRPATAEVGGTVSGGIWEIGEGIGCDLGEGVGKRGTTWKRLGTTVF